MSFTNQIDVANRALQHLGIPRISTFTDSSRQAREAAFAIDKIRRAELRRSVWVSAVHRAVLRPYGGSAKNVTFPTWAVGTTYGAGDIVADSAGFLWISPAASNTGNTPGAGGVNPAWVVYFGPTVAQVWGGTVQYFPGDIVYETTSFYICVLASLNNDPNADAGVHWHLIQGATGAAAIIFSPIGIDPPHGTNAARTVYKLPANYIRIASQDPKAPAVVRLGVTAGMQFNDWEIEGGYLFTNDASPIIFRFVADTTDVTALDDLFNECWAAHLGLELCEPLTQSQEKLNILLGLYNRYLEMAKLTSAIEGGSTENEIPEGGAGQPAQGEGGGQRGR